MSNIISIIVPIYKVEKYLDRCINSILNQTFKDFELILVDDGSPDRCGDICEEYAKKDKRIKVIHKENGGLSDARNAGLDIAKGEYIGFVDSDDWIEIDMYEKLYYSCELNDSDISIIGVYEINENGNIIDQYIPSLDKIGLKDILKRAPPWNKLFKRELFYNNNLKFKEGRFYEDLELIPKLFIQSKKISCVNYNGYNYLQRSSSTTHVKDKKILDNLWAYTKIKEYLVNQDLYRDYEIEFNEGVKYFKEFYLNILIEYPTSFLIKNFNNIYLEFRKIDKLKCNEIFRFVGRHLKIIIKYNILNKSMNN